LPSTTQPSPFAEVVEVVPEPQAVEEPVTVAEAEPAEAETAPVEAEPVSAEGLTADEVATVLAAEPEPVSEIQ
jgi:hypothetical protein